MGKIFKGGDCLRMFETNFGCRNYEWFSKVAMHLASQNVEIVRRCGTLGHLEIDILRVQIIISTIECVVCLTVDVLQKSFHVTGRVLWARPIKPVRKQKNQT